MGLTACGPEPSQPHFCLQEPHSHHLTNPPFTPPHRLSWGSSLGKARNINRTHNKQDHKSCQVQDIGKTVRLHWAPNLILPSFAFPSPPCFLKGRFKPVQGKSKLRRSCWVHFLLKGSHCTHTGWHSMEHCPGSHPKDTSQTIVTINVSVQLMPLGNRIERNRESLQLHFNFFWGTLL